MRAAFPPECRTKRRMAEEIAVRVAELEEVLPPLRKWYESGEDERMSVFDAVGLAMAWYRSQNSKWVG